MKFGQHFTCCIGRENGRKLSIQINEGVSFTKCSIYETRTPWTSRSISPESGGFCRCWMSKKRRRGPKRPWKRSRAAAVACSSHLRRHQRRRRFPFWTALSIEETKGNFEKQFFSVWENGTSIYAPRHSCAHVCLSLD